MIGWFRGGAAVLRGLLVCLTILGTAEGWAQCGSQKLLGGLSGAAANFGGSVHVRGERAIVGAPGEVVSGVQSGAAYVYRRVGTGWIEEGRLSASDRLAGDRFGTAVSISGDWAVVGAPQRAESGANSGAAYVFRWNGSNWAQFVKLREPLGDPATGDFFGQSVSLSGDFIAIGAWSDDERATDAGAVYLFGYNGATWAFSQKLLASDGQAGDHLGYSVSLDGEWLLACADEDDDRGSNSGSAYFYRYNGTNWTQSQKILAPDGTASDLFGWNVSLSFPVAILGAVQDSPVFSAQGSAYNFRHNGVNWAFERRLNAADPAAGDLFGFGVAIAGDVAVVGSPRDDDRGTDSGSLYVFDYIGGTNWVQRPKLTMADGAAGDEFGRAVTLESGNTIWAGAVGDDDPLRGSNAGSATYYWLAAPWIDDQPDDAEVEAGAAAEFEVSSAGPGALTYRWRRAGLPLFDDGRISGAATPQLRIDPVVAGDTGFYTVAVTNGCGTTISTAAELTLGGAGGLAGDLNCDGLVNFDDIEGFVLALISQSAYEAAYPGCYWLNADANGDGIVDFNDIGAFTQCLIAGGCP
jgi:hypothetical protein